MSDKALVLDQVSYEYRSDFLVKRYQALKPLSLEVYQGESFGFLGHNGAGKTTTIKCILGLIHNYKGEISLFGRSSRDPEARASVGYLPEHPYFYDHLTVSEALEMYAALAGVPSRQRKEAVKRALNKLGIYDRRSASLRTLSKGLTQRLGMAQAIVAEPKLLILDEPFSGLDPLGRKEFKDLIFSLKQEGTTVFISSHILDDVEFLCERASILVMGELKKIISLDELSDRPNDSYEIVVRGELATDSQLARSSKQIEVRGAATRLSFDSFDAAQKALREIANSGGQIDSFRPVRQSLEDQFVQVIRDSSITQP